jgi:hypothetical protein
MPEPSASDRSTYLQQISDRLPFDDAQKVEILRELAGHLADSTAHLERQGLSPAVAERAAIERLGPAERLADELTTARRTPRRLLAAAGAGTLAAAGGVIYGYLFAALALSGISIAAFVVGSYLHWFGPFTGDGLDGSTITLVALGVGAYVAARRLTLTVSGRAGYHIRIARRATALVGGGLVLLYALVGWRGALNWPEVGILLSLPTWFVVGAWRASELRFPSRQWRLRVIGLAFVVVLAALGLGFNQQANGEGSGGFHPTGVEKLGLPTPDAILAATVGEGIAATTTGSTEVFINVSDRSLLAGWTDLRIEAWPGSVQAGSDPGLAGLVDPAAKAPFAVEPAYLEAGPQSNEGGAIPPAGAQLSGAVAIDRNPGVRLAWIALTGVGPDGHRYILEGPSFKSTTFNGTALDWLSAVIAGR